MELNFVTIAYKIPYYEETAQIYYDNNAKKHILCFKDKKQVLMENSELEKGEIELNGNVWKFTKVVT